MEYKYKKRENKLTENALQRQLLPINVNGNEFLLIVQVALDLAFEAGKW